MIGDNVSGALAQRILFMRSVRRELFPGDLFDEYAWNMLLILFASLTQNRVVSEEDLLRQAGVGIEAGRRWVKHLVEDGQIEQRADGADVILTAAAIERLRKYLGGIRSTITDVATGGGSV